MFCSNLFLVPKRNKTFLSLRNILKFFFPFCNIQSTCHRDEKVWKIHYCHLKKYYLLRQIDIFCVKLLSSLFPLLCKFQKVCKFWIIHSWSQIYFKIFLGNMYFTDFNRNFQPEHEIFMLQNVVCGKLKVIFMVEYFHAKSISYFLDF